MCAKTGAAVVALFSFLIMTPPAALAASPKGGEGHPAPGAGITPITTEAFDERLTTSVEEKGGIKVEQGNTLRVELHDEAKVIFFTQPGHRAHPGIVEVRIVEEDGLPGIDTAGWWAGDAQAFEHWFRVFERRNERLSREWRKKE